jgi:hypothetical protein
LYISRLLPIRTGGSQFYCVSSLNRPIHEASRGGHTDVVKFLYKHGADVNARTSEGAGGTPLWWAQKVHGDDHPTASFLESIGALSIGPEL